MSTEQIEVKKEADLIISAFKSIPMTTAVFDGRFVEGTWRGKTSADFKYDAKNKRVVYDKAGYLRQALDIAKSGKKTSCSKAASNLRKEKSKAAAKELRCNCSPLPKCKGGLSGIGYIFGPHE
jgi:hypothetical protein